MQTGPMFEPGTKDCIFGGVIIQMLMCCKDGLYGVSLQWNWSDSMYDLR